MFARDWPGLPCPRRQLHYDQFVAIQNNNAPETKSSRVAIQFIVDQNLKTNNGSKSQ